VLNEVKQKVMGLCAWFWEISGAANQKRLSICARRGVANRKANDRHNKQTGGSFVRRI
jgi:hypothetical protein